MLPIAYWNKMCLIILLGYLIYPFKEGDQYLTGQGETP